MRQWMIPVVGIGGDRHGGTGDRDDAGRSHVRYRSGQLIWLDPYVCRNVIRGSAGSDEKVRYCRDLKDIIGGAH